MDDAREHAPHGPHNWGRWGPDDQLGALNLITPGAVMRGLAAAREGRVLSLAQPIEGATASGRPARVPHMAGRPLPQHYMAVDGGDQAAGAPSLPGGRRVADDALVLSPHGTTTHMDALCHMWAGERMYNGHPAGRVGSRGASRLGVEHAAARGVLTRGVLFDAARHRGAARLGPDDRVGAADLEAMPGARLLAPGDAAVVRTGWPLAWEEDPGLYRGAQPGLDGSAVRWLAARDAAVVVCDNTGVQALGADGGPVDAPEDDAHLVLLWRHGVPLVEMARLEGLGSELAGAGRADFLLVVAPLPVGGGTGSPVNPLAVL
ncbi:cyclase family protein [Nocardiopsis sp. RSe5-2]|uniref:Cyclase family protein n=1 Tax=Nocardiopsis endophytica TaxID=3018445 RepID=A0ABT4UF85_9ACTN|nr:cyclase family protein [Nocardiopsis endophytica]MDA2815149.1 cyclase family protein [Nocardiopsis endophytica]